MQQEEYIILSGYSRNNIIVLDDDVQIPDSIKVTVIVPHTTPTKKTSGLCGIWKDYRPIDEIVKEIIASRSVGRDIPSHGISD